MKDSAKNILIKIIQEFSMQALFRGFLTMVTTIVGITMAYTGIITKVAVIETKVDAVQKDVDFLKGNKNVSNNDTKEYDTIVFVPCRDSVVIVPVDSVQQREKIYFASK